MRKMIASWTKALRDCIVKARDAGYVARAGRNLGDIFEGLRGAPGARPHCPYCGTHCIGVCQVVSESKEQKKTQDEK